MLDRELLGDKISKVGIELNPIWEEHLESLDDEVDEKAAKRNKKLSKVLSENIRKIISSESSDLAKLEYHPNDNQPLLPHNEQAT